MQVESVEVESLTVRQMLQQHDINDILVVVIDTEGFDWQVNHPSPHGFLSPVSDHADRGNVHAQHGVQVIIQHRFKDDVLVVLQILCVCACHGYPSRPGQNLPAGHITRLCILMHAAGSMQSNL